MGTSAHISFSLSLALAPTWLVLVTALLGFPTALGVFLLSRVSLGPHYSPRGLLRPLLVHPPSLVRRGFDGRRMRDHSQTDPVARRDRRAVGRIEYEALHLVLGEASSTVDRAPLPHCFTALAPPCPLSARCPSRDRRRIFLNGHGLLVVRAPRRIRLLAGAALGVLDTLDIPDILARVLQHSTGDLRAVGSDLANTAA